MAKLDVNFLREVQLRYSSASKVWVNGDKEEAGSDTIMLSMRQAELFGKNFELTFEKVMLEVYT